VERGDVPAGKFGGCPSPWKIGRTPPPLEKIGAQEERAGTFHSVNFDC